MSLLCYGATHDNLRVYFSPRAIYVRSTSKTQPGGVVPAGQTTTSGYAATGSVGGQYALGHRFSAYAEVGYGFSHSSQGWAASGSNAKLIVRLGLVGGRASDAAPAGRGRRDPLRGQLLIAETAGSESYGAGCSIRVSWWVCTVGGT